MSRRQPIRLLPLVLFVPVALGAQTPARRHVDVPAVAPHAAAVRGNGVGKQGPYAPVMDHQAFVDGSDSGMVHDGFFEREVHRVTRSYGNIVQVFSTYEERRTADGPVEGRGVNALQLFWDGKRWWVASAIWFDEDPAHPIPAEYLP